MSVADKPVAARAPRSPQQTLALGSLLGAVYVLASLWIFFAGIPTLWGQIFAVAEGEQPILNDFLSETLLLVFDFVVLAGLVFGGYFLLRHQTARGLRAGIFVASLELLLIVLIGFGVGRMLENAAFDRTVGWAGMAIVMGLLAAGVGYLFLTPAWAGLLDGLEEQGWFTVAPYKGNQGVRIMRRATVLGALLIGFAGIATMVSHRSFGSDRVESNDWSLAVPFTRRSVDVDRLVERLRDGKQPNEDERLVLRELVGTEQPNEQQLQQIAADHAGRSFGYTATIPLMYKLHLVLPVVLGAILIWFSIRLVNVPTFADFLIATEAEMNKVSWTSRKRLFQDTIVVLVTVLLMTVFLFLIDILWIKVLSWATVLQVDVKAQLQKQQEKSQW